MTGCSLGSLNWQRLRRIRRRRICIFHLVEVRAGIDCGAQVGGIGGLGQKLGLVVDLM